MIWSIRCPSEEPQMRPTRQKEIIDAARTEFAEKGYGAASIRDIAQRCGMSMSALYHYYPGKQDLLKAILDEGVEAYFGACERALADAGPDPAERLEVLVEAAVLFRADHPVKSSVMTTAGRIYLFRMFGLLVRSGAWPASAVVVLLIDITLPSASS